MEKAGEAQGKCANLFYVRAVLKAYRKRFTSAIKDLNKAIDKSEDNVVLHYYLRGILQAQQMRVRDALKDFSTCLHFDKEFRQAYLQRSKCYQMVGE